MKTEVYQFPRALMTIGEVTEFLQCSRNTFYKYAAHPQTRIRGVHGKYITSSIREEFERIYGIPYEKAI